MPPWYLLTCPFRILISWLMQLCRISSRVRSATSPRSTLYRYFVPMPSGTGCCRPCAHLFDSQPGGLCAWTYDPERYGYYTWSRCIAHPLGLTSTIPLSSRTDAVRTESPCALPAIALRRSTLPAKIQGLTRLMRRQTASGPVSWMGSPMQNGQDASGLILRRNRFYDPASGRFTQEDDRAGGRGEQLWVRGGGIRYRTAIHMALHANRPRYYQGDSLS
jgi:hypothetical protein